MRDADQEHRTPAVADAQKLDRPALRRLADRLEARLARKLLDEGPGALTQRPEPQELLVLGDACEDVAEV